MKNEAISLAVPVLLLMVVVPIQVQAAVDIFSGMDATTTELPMDGQDGDAEELEQGPQTCIADVYSKKPIKFDESALSLDSISSAVKAFPKPPPMPKLPQTWARFTNIFQLPRFSEMGQEFKAIIDQYRAVIQIYVNQWMGFFKQRYQTAVENVQGQVQEMNRKIHDSFATHFEEFQDVCLPDRDACLQSIQKGIESYDERLNKNVAACESFAKRQVDQHERWVEKERKLLERPFLRVEDCFGKGRVGISLASCVGNMVGNVVKASTDGLKRFSEAMGTASNSLVDRLGKFQECVVDRRKLLDRGQERIAERAKRCLRKQQDKDVFGGDEDAGFEDDEGVF
uniref:Putative gsg5 type mucin n=1 Tax=Aedes albopictus TaxID=7160 RepID=A0A1W7R7P5_AEDAL